MMIKKTRLVYSTEVGQTCSNCEQAKDACICENEQVLGDGKLRIQYETKGRKGKGVTVIKGIPLVESELKVLAKKIKQTISTGGSVKGGNIEIQGDQRATLKDFFEHYISTQDAAARWTLKIIK